jgi:hypothetical protein
MAELDLEERIKRPLGVQIILIVFIVVTLLSLYSFLRVMVKMPEIFSEFSLLETILSITLIALILINMVGSILLYQLKTLAFWVFVGTNLFSLPLVLIIKFFGTSNPIIVLKVPNTVLILSLVVWIIVLIYIWGLKSKGILK